jgi:hypothetical protein
MTYSSSGGGRSSSFATTADMASRQLLDDERRPLRAPPGTPPLHKSRSLSPGGANRYGHGRSATTETRDAYAHHGVSSEDNPVRTRTSSPPETPRGSHARRDDDQPTQPPPRARHRSSSASARPTRHKGAKPINRQERSTCESPPTVEMSGSASTASSLSPVPPRCDDASKSRDDAPASTSPNPNPPEPQQVGRRSVSPRTVSPRGSNVSRIIAALETVIPTGHAAAAPGSAAANGKGSAATPKVAASSGSDREEVEDAYDEYAASRGESTSPIEIGSTPHPSTVLRTVEPKRAANAVSGAVSESDGGFKKLEAPISSSGESNLTSLTALSSASSWRRPPPSPRAAATSKARPVEPRYSPCNSDSPMLLETIDLPPEEDVLYGGFIPLSGAAGISNHHQHQVASPPRDVPDFGNISAISHDDASGESPVLVQVHRNTLEVTEATADLGTGDEEEEEEEDRDVPTELVKSRSSRTSATVLSETLSEPSTTTEVTSNLTATAGSHNLPAPTSPRFSRSAIMAQRSKISSRRISKSSGGKSKRSTPAGPESSPPSTDRRRTPRRGSSTPPKPTSTPMAASPRSKPRSTSTGRRARYGGSKGPTSESEEESIDSQATQDTLDPMLVQYFLDLVLAEEGIVDGDRVEVGTVPASDSKDATDADSWGGRSEADPRMSDAEARSYAKAMLDDHFGSGEKREGSARSPASVIVDFWRSFACDSNLWQNSDSNKEEKRPSSGTRSAPPGEQCSRFEDVRHAKPIRDSRHDGHNNNDRCIARSVVVGQSVRSQCRNKEVCSVGHYELLCS